MKEDKEFEAIFESYKVRSNKEDALIAFILFIFIVLVITPMVSLAYKINNEYEEAIELQKEELIKQGILKDEIKQLIDEAKD